MESVPDQDLDQDEENDTPEFFCHICKLNCESANNLQSHFMGGRHRRKEEALRRDLQGDDQAKAGEDPGEDQAQPGEDQSGLYEPCDEEAQTAEYEPLPQESLEDQINATENAEPALGLEYIYEHRCFARSTYECRLCVCYLAQRQMYMHIFGARHRINYLALHHPSFGITTSIVMKGQKKFRRLKKACKTVEEEYGRKQINVIKGEFESTYFADPEPDRFIDCQPKPVVEKKIDFTNEEFEYIGEKPNVPAPELTFKQIKAEYQAMLNRRETQRKKLQEKALLVKDKEAKENEAVKVDDGDGKTDVGKKKKKSGKNFFPNKSDLFEYLKNFKVFELADVHFLLKVSEKLRNTLTNNKEFCLEDDAIEEVAYTEIEEVEMEIIENEPDTNLNQSADLSITNQECATEGDQTQVLSADQLKINKNPKTARPLSKPSKLSFRIAGSTTEKPLVSSELLSNMQQDFAAKSKKNKMAGSTDDDDLSPTEDETSSSMPVFDRTQDVEDQRVISTNLNNRGTSVRQPRPVLSEPTDRSSDTSIREPSSNELLKGSNVSRYSSVAANTRDQTCSRFPPNTREPVRNSADSVMRVPSSREMFRNPADSSCQETTSYKHLSSAYTGAAFPQQLPNTQQGAPQAALPMSKDAVTAKFFESLKNMEVSDVVSTLTKVTATNPALRGIHVPSLVRYLMDTGKLKSSSNKQDSL